jgi:hypothetical protein
LTEIVRPECEKALGRDFSPTNCGTDFFVKSTPESVEATPAGEAPRRIAMLIYPGVAALDVAGPLHNPMQNKMDPGSEALHGVSSAMALGKRAAGADQPRTDAPRRAGLEAAGAKRIGMKLDCGLGHSWCPGKDSNLHGR